MTKIRSITSRGRFGFRVESLSDGTAVATCDGCNKAQPLRAAGHGGAELELECCGREKFVLELVDEPPSDDERATEPPPATVPSARGGP